MFFKNLHEISNIVARTSCAIFAIPPETPLNLPYALYLRPDESKKTSIIAVEQMRDFLKLAQNHETRDRFFVITPAEAMNESAANAFLKTFEEPKPFYHFILLTETPNALLPTIRSRAQIFYQKKPGRLDQAPTANQKNLEQAKKLIAATPANLPQLATEFTKSKTNARGQILTVIETAIELLYKSYFKTKNPKFLTKLQDFINLHQNLTENGHLKLHLVADLC